MENLSLSAEWFAETKVYLDKTQNLYHLLESL